MSGDDTERAREWLNKKHFTADSGLTLDCLAMLPDEHVLALTIGQLAQIMDAFGDAATKEACRDVCEYCVPNPNWLPAEYITNDGWRHHVGEKWIPCKAAGEREVVAREAYGAKDSGMGSYARFPYGRYIAANQATANHGTQSRT